VVVHKNRASKAPSVLLSVFAALSNAHEGKVCICSHSVAQVSVCVRSLVCIRCEMACDAPVSEQERSLSALLLALVLTFLLRSPFSAFTRAGMRGTDADATLVRVQE
jgi:hypothetical protein